MSDFEHLLACDIQAVWLPLPIDLHCPYTKLALAAGTAVLCEKPAAGCVDDVDDMIAAPRSSEASGRGGIPDIVSTGDRELEAPISRRGIWQSENRAGLGMLAARAARFWPQRLGRPIAS